MHIQHKIRTAYALAMVWVLLIPSVLAAQENQQRAVSALGRIEPRGGIIQVGSPSTPEAISGSILKQLLVKEGDKVIFSSYAGDEISVGDDEFLLLRESDILATF